MCFDVPWKTDYQRLRLFYQAQDTVMKFHKIMEIYSIFRIEIGDKHQPQFVSQHVSRMCLQAALCFVRFTHFPLIVDPQNTLRQNIFQLSARFDLMQKSLMMRVEQMTVKDRAAFANSLYELQNLEDRLLITICFLDAVWRCAKKVDDTESLKSIVSLIHLSCCDHHFHKMVCDLLNTAHNAGMVLLKMKLYELDSLIEIFDNHYTATANSNTTLLNNFNHCKIGSN